jgi:cobalt/nickel transport system ATP-binding protein
VAGRGRVSAVTEDDTATGAAGGAGSERPVALELSEVAFAYPDGNQALFGVDLRVHTGERLAVLGPNGAGKTTLLLHLNGILGKAAGSNAVGAVRVGGVEVSKATLGEVRRRVGLVFQDPDDQLFMPTVRDDVAFGPTNLGLRGAELDARVDEALDQVGMRAFADRPPHHLSFGQRRRVAVATVLAMRCEVLVLDEPSSNLDPASRRELLDVLAGLPVTVVVVTHDLPFALELCERSVILDSGRIVHDAGTLDILQDPELLEAHRLELPVGFDPAAVVPRGRTSASASLP